MRHYSQSSFLGIALLIASTASFAFALPGAAPTDSAIGEYDPATGQIVVSINGVNNWWVERVGYSAMTGDDPSGLPTSGGLVSNNDVRVGESSFTVDTFTDLNLGNIAEPNIPADGSLQIFWNAGLGAIQESRPLLHPDFINGPPVAAINGPFNVNTYDDPLNILLKAGASVDPTPTGTLSYRWDLDNDGTFEIDSGANRSHRINDVTSTFGGVGTYPVSVEVFDGEFWDTASTMVNIYYDDSTPPPPPPPTSGSVSATYDAISGQITVNVNDVVNWYIESASGGMTGDAPTGIPAAGGLLTDNDLRIGETAFAPFSYAMSLGNVAQTGLRDEDFLIYWNGRLGEPLQSAPIIFNGSPPIPEPTSLLLGCMASLFMLSRREA